MCRRGRGFKSRRGQKLRVDRVQIPEDAKVDEGSNCLYISETETEAPAEGGGYWYIKGRPIGGGGDLSPPPPPQPRVLCPLRGRHHPHPARRQDRRGGRQKG